MARWIDGRRPVFGSKRDRMRDPRPLKKLKRTSPTPPTPPTPRTLQQTPTADPPLSRPAAPPPPQPPQPPTPPKTPVKKNYPSCLPLKPLEFSNAKAPVSRPAAWPQLPVPKTSPAMSVPPAQREPQVKRCWLAVDVPRLIRGKGYDLVYIPKKRKTQEQDGTEGGEGGLKGGDRIQLKLL
ncbi:hypothetical protein EDC01DRAFT_784236 [Geopyxis carbonaria]|nr:hypothetical protein EDC01DRAFT_784236 [Geopyxis carbonaria]